MIQVVWTIHHIIREAKQINRLMITAKLSGFQSGIPLRDGQQVTRLLEDFRNCARGGNRGLQHYQYLRALLCAILFESQKFLRVDAKIDHSAAISPVLFP